MGDKHVSKWFWHIWYASYSQRYKTLWGWGCIDFREVSSAQGDQRRLHWRVGIWKYWAHRVEKHSRQREQSELRRGDEERTQHALKATYTLFETAGGFIEVASRQSWGMSTGLSWILHLIWHAPWGSGLYTPNGPVQHLAKCWWHCGAYWIPFEDERIAGEKRICHLSESAGTEGVSWLLAPSAMAGRSDTQGRLPWGTGFHLGTSSLFSESRS